MKNWIAVTAVILTACAAHPLELGDGRYSTTGSVRRGIQAARQEALEDAKEFCADRGGKRVQIITFDDHSGFLIIAPASSTLTFSCQ